MSDVSLPHRRTVWKSAGRTITFWVLAILGLPIMTSAWLWLNLASLEEATEQPKALQAGTSMAGTTLIMGGVPLLFVHVLGVAILATIARPGQGGARRAWLVALVAVVVASMVGLATTLSLTGGQVIVPVGGDYAP